MTTQINPEDIWLSSGVDGIPDVVSQYEDHEIVIPLTLDYDDDEKLSNRLQEVTSVFASALAVLGRLEAKITYQQHISDKEFGQMMTQMLQSDPDIYKNSGRSVEVMRAFVRESMSEEWQDQDDKIHRAIAIRDRLKKKADALGAYKETLSRHITVRQMELQKGMRI